jgi:hypothetical protein
MYEFSFTTPLAVPGGYSTVVFLVSEIAPSYLRGRGHDGLFTDGAVPANTPEPGTVVMSAAALAIAAGAVVARRRNAVNA